MPAAPSTYGAFIQANRSAKQLRQLGLMISKNVHAMTCTGFVPRDDDQLTGQLLDLAAELREIESALSIAIDRAAEIAAAYLAKFPREDLRRAFQLIRVESSGAVAVRLGGGSPARSFPSAAALESGGGKRTSARLTSEAPAVAQGCTPHDERRPVLGSSTAGGVAPEAGQSAAVERRVPVVGLNSDE